MATLEQLARIETILREWHEAGRARFERDCPTLDYDGESYQKHHHVGAKYIRLDAGHSGCFMVEIASGLVFEIKGYGVPNRRKIAGVAWEPAFHGSTLERVRYSRGSYDYRKGDMDGPR